MALLRPVALCLLAGLAVAPVRAQTAPAVTHLANAGAEHFLFVGNSFFYFNNGMASFVTRLMAGAPEADRRPYNATMVGIGGSGFDWHDMESYFRPNAVGSYSFDAKNNIVETKRAKMWDAAIVMDCSQCPIHPTLSKVFTAYAKSNSETIRRHGAEPVFFMSWAYADKPEMTAQLAEAYTVAGNANQAMVIPAGLAFAAALKARPGLELYMPDNRHPTVMGSYLGAATVYASLYRRSPEENSYTAGIDPETARFLRVTAWKTVQGYNGEALTR